MGLECAMAASGIVLRDSGDITHNPRDGVDQWIVSASHAQSKELLKEVAKHFAWLSVATGRTLLNSRPAAECITLANGRRISALAPNPATVRGKAGDLTLDEYAAAPFERDLWAALGPITNPTLKRSQGYKIRIVSTPLGDDNRFYRLAMTPSGDGYSRHFVDIHRAIADGFPADIEDLREDAGDADTFAQEYECAFLSSSARYISSELYESSLYDRHDLPTNEAGRHFGGMDVARKSTGDLSVLVDLVRLQKRLWCLSTEERRGSSWADQEAWVKAFLSRAKRLAIDSTGLGDQFAERLQIAFGASRVEAVGFTSKTKEMLATGLRLHLERNTLMLPRDNTALKRDLLSLRRVQTKAGNVIYEAPRTQGSHADRAWALALAAHSAGSTGEMGSDSIPRPQSQGSGLSDYM